MSEPTADRGQLEVAIAALEAQREILGDEVVDTALAPLKAQLAEAEDEPRVRRRQVSIMFADLSGFTTLSENLDPEALARMLGAFWHAVDGIITDHRGNVLQHMGDGVLAVWGDTQSMEDDAQQAVRAALRIIELVEREGITVEGTRLPATVSVGINTGLVHLSALDDFGYTTLGDTVNVAARLEGTADRGQTWISRSTYHQVRGVFDVEDMGEQQLKGREEPVRAYRVVRERPSVERVHERGLDDARTKLVGRGPEQARLHDAFRSIVDHHTPTTMVLIGDPGIGKSRLLDLVRSWVDAESTITKVEGRALPDSAGSPFALLRSALAHRFAILDTDARDVVFDKLVAGFSGVPTMDPHAVARSVGWLAGFVSGESGLGRDDAQFRRNAAVSDLREYVSAVAGATGPLVIVLEDLHWADADSLELFADLAAADIAGLAILGSTRPVLLGEHEAWGEPGRFGAGHDAIRLHPLAGDHVDELLAHLLAPMSGIPATIRERVTEQCDGNPFHVEELVKMLIDERVIETSTTPWTFDAGRLQRAKVPTTLTGVLQARLDHLSLAEFEVVQAGSVFGRFFWDRAVDELIDGEHETTEALSSLEQAELVLPQATSRFTDTAEEAFKHDFTRVVTYDTIDLERRPELHARAAAWLERAGGDRADEFALGIAQHHEAAGNATDAAAWYTRAARQAQGQSSYVEAARLFALAAEHALPDGTERLQLTVEQSYSLVVAGRFDEAKDLLERLMETAELTGQTRHWLLACTELSRIALFRDGDFDRARHLLNDGLRRGDATGHVEETLLVRHQLGNLAIVDGDWEEAIRLHTENADRADAGGELYRRGWTLNSLAHAHAHAGNADEAMRLADEVIRTAEDVADPRLKMAGLAQKGLTHLHEGEWDLSAKWFEEAQALNRRNGDPEKLATVANYLAEGRLLADDLTAAHRHADEARAVSMRAGVRTELVRAVIALAALAASHGHRDLAEEALTAASHSSAAAGEARRLLAMIAERIGIDPRPDDDATSLASVADRLAAELGPAPTR
ncbi:MAG: adenylate/guanylate cyclase domain-containing protein [Actinomycetota bacterium]